MSVAFLSTHSVGCKLRRPVSEGSVQHTAPIVHECVEGYLKSSCWSQARLQHAPASLPAGSRSHP